MNINMKKIYTEKNRILKLLMGGIIIDTAHFFYYSLEI